MVSLSTTSPECFTPLAEADSSSGRITAAYPKLDSLVLNAGFQRTINFTKPEGISLATFTSEMQTNYLSPLHTITHFLPHLTSIGPSTPASIVFVSSGLALIPLPRCANYCATKAAIHSLAWSLRVQLSNPLSPETHHIKVVEVIPPAVQTELHPQQADLAAAGMDKFGVPLEGYADETWNSLRGDKELDEVMTSAATKMLGHVEDAKKEKFAGFIATLVKQGALAKP